MYGANTYYLTPSQKKMYEQLRASYPEHAQRFANNCTDVNKIVAEKAGKTPKEYIQKLYTQNTQKK